MLVLFLQVLEGHGLTPLVLKPKEVLGSVFRGKLLFIKNWLIFLLFCSSGQLSTYSKN